AAAQIVADPDQHGRCSMNAWVSTRLFGFSVYKNGGRHDAMDWVTGQVVLKKTRSRMTVMTALFVLAYGLIAARMTHLTLTRTAATEDDITVEEITQSAGNIHRGDILDREGVLLATSLKTSSLYADP